MLHIIIHVSNYGRTPAIISESCIKIQYQVGLPKGTWETFELNAIPISTVITIEKPFSQTSEIKIPKFEWESIEKGNSRLLCIGEIKYKDIFNKNHRTWFHWYWNQRLKCFEISNAEHNNGYD